MRIRFVGLLVFVFILPLTAFAQRPDAPLYALPGEYPVGTREYVIDADGERPLNVTVWYPAIDGEQGTTYVDNLIRIDSDAVIENAEPDLSGGSYPLVVFSHGSAGYRYQSLWLTEHLPSYGFVVIAADHPTNTIIDAVMDADNFAPNIPMNFVYRPQDVLREINFAETLTAPDGDLPGLIDVNRTAVIGHSFGGYTALAVGGQRMNFDQLASYCAQANTDTDRYNACVVNDYADAIAAELGADPGDDAFPPISDPRVQAVVALAPWNGPLLDTATLNASTIPTMILVGSSDGTTIPERDAYSIFQRLGSPYRALVTFAYADHFIFVDKCFDLAIRFGLFDHCSDSVWDLDRVHDLSKQYVTAFLLDVFYQDPDAHTALSPANVTDTGVFYQRFVPPTSALTTPTVIARYPHDPDAFTQGLVLADGVFYESDGQYGESTLRRVDVETGEVLQQVAVPEEYFAEGLARVDDRLVQITWQEETAFVYDRETFELLDTWTYEGEGWGLCYDGDSLYMSDGSATITVRNPQTFDVMSTFTVILEDEPIDQLNELECVGDAIYANIWQTDYMVRFDKTTGVIDAVIDASGLLTAEEAVEANVLNGIAYDSENDQFLITGKNWPYVFRVTFDAP